MKTAGFELIRENIIHTWNMRIEQLLFEALERKEGKGFSVNALKGRCHKLIRGNISTYYLDEKPILVIDYEHLEGY